MVDARPAAHGAPDPGGPRAASGGSDGLQRAFARIAGWGRPRAFLGILGSCALVAFLASALLGPELPLRHDGPAYHEGAVNILAGRGYIQHWRSLDKVSPAATELRAFFPVGYSAFLAGVYAFTEPRPMAAVVANAVLLALSGVLVYGVGRRVAGEGVGRVASVAFVLMSLTTRMSQTVYPEPLFMTLVLGCLWAATCWCSWPAQVVAGLLLGMAHLVRTNSLAMPFVLFVAFVLLRERWGRAAARALVVGGVSLVVVAPWTLRNWQRFGRFVAVATNGGFNLWMGNNPKSSGTYQWPEFPPDVVDARDEAEWDQRLTRHAMAFIRSRPGLFLARMPVKLSHAIGFGMVGEDAVRNEGPVRVVGRLALSVMLAVLLVIAVVQAGWAVGRLMRQRSLAAGWALIPMLFILLFAGFVMVFHGCRRFLYPAYPFIALSCAIAGAWFLEWRRGQRMRGAS